MNIEPGRSEGAWFSVPPPRGCIEHHLQSGCTEHKRQRRLQSEGCSPRAARTTRSADLEHEQGRNTASTNKGAEHEPKRSAPYPHDLDHEHTPSPLPTPSARTRTTMQPVRRSPRARVRWMRHSPSCIAFCSTA